MAIAKITGGNSAKTIKLYHERTSRTGTKNLAQSNTFRHLARLERDVAEGKLTEDEFAEQQSDILTAFTEKWGDPTPSSNETDEQRQARRERKACQKAEEDKERVRLMCENGFIEGYTVILTGTFTKAESDRIKALDDPTTEVYAKVYKPSKEYLQYHYRADYGAELKLITTLEEGEKNGLLHTHNFLNSPFKMTKDNWEETKRFLEWIENQWRHYSGATKVKAEVAHKVGGVWAIAPYMSKCFFDLEKHKKGKHYYWATDNLRKCISTEKKEVADEEVNKAISKARQGEDELVAYVENCPEMEGWRVINTYFHDAEDRIDDTTFVSFTIVNIAKDIAEGRLGNRRSAADVEIWEDNQPMFARIKFYGEGVTIEPKIPFDRREWIADTKPRERSEQRRDCNIDNITVEPSTKPIPRQRIITFCGLQWLENLPIPQVGRRIVQSNGLIFDEKEWGGLV